MKSKLSKELYVRHEKDGDDEYLLADAELRRHLDVSETRLVGVYKLVGTIEISAEIKAVRK